MCRMGDYNTNISGTVLSLVGITILICLGQW